MNVSFECSWGPNVTFQGSEINDISPSVVISTSVSRRAQSRTLQDVTNISWFSSCFLSRTCYSRAHHRSCSELMDLECGMFQKSGLLTSECGRPWLQRWQSGHPEELLWFFCWSQKKGEGLWDKSLFIQSITWFPSTYSNNNFSFRTLSGVCGTNMTLSTSF